MPEEGDGALIHHDLSAHRSASRHLAGLAALGLLLLLAGLWSTVALSEGGPLRGLIRTCMEVASAGLAAIRAAWAHHPAATATIAILAGSLLWAAARAVASAVANGRLARRLVRYTPGLWPALDRVLGRIDGDVGTRIFLDPSASSPAFTVGLWHPRICLSPALLAELSGPEIRAVLLHELAHLERRDPLRLLVVRFLADFLWFIPASRPMACAFTRAVEEAADDRAVALAARPLDLAAAIVKGARRRLRPAPQAAALGGTSTVEARVSRLLNGERTMSPALPGWRVVASLVVITSIVSVLLSPSITRSADRVSPPWAQASTYTGVMCDIPRD